MPSTCTTPTGTPASSRCSTASSATAWPGTSSTSTCCGRRWPWASTASSATGSTGCTKHSANADAASPYVKGGRGAAVGRHDRNRREGALPRRSEPRPVTDRPHDDESAADDAVLGDGPE